MDTINIVLMIILASIVSFVFGEEYGRYRMKNAINKALKDTIDGLKKVSQANKKEE